MIDVLTLPDSTGHDIVAPWGRFSGLFRLLPRHALFSWRNGVFTDAI